MSPELIGIIAVGVACLLVYLASAGIMLALNNRWEKQHRQRMARYDEQMGRESVPLSSAGHFHTDVLRAEMNQGFAQQDERIRNLERGQAHLSGQFSELKDYFVHRPSSGNTPEAGD